MKRYIALLLAVLVVSCGGGDDAGSGGSAAGGGSNPGGGSGGGTSAAAGAHVEESDPAVTLSSGWTNADARFGWSGGTAVRSNVAGATATLAFTGTSVRWMSAHGRSMGKARVRVDGGPAKEVSLLTNTGDVIHAPAITIHDLSDGPHTLTIEVVSGVVVVDAFEVQPSTTLSHWQDTDPNARFSAGWAKASTSPPWSGNGQANVPELPVTAQETYTAGETLTLPFRGTGIAWVGYKGPDGGIATVQIDGGAPVEVDTYSATAKVQQVVFTAAGLSDANHTLTITATGRRNAASSAPRIVVDAFNVMTPGRRYENDDPAIAYSGNVWNRNHIARVWSGGSSATSNVQGASATFSFTGTSVSWIGCRKSSAGGTAKVYIDGVLVQEIRLKESYPIEGYQMTVFRADGLAPGPHTLTVEVASATDGPYVVVDAFDVHP
jgi:hypothetical protein